MPTLNARATATFGKGDLGIRWPYGMHTLKRSDDQPGSWAAEHFEERNAEQQARQEVMVAWAEEHGLRSRQKGCCPLWLQRDTQRACRPYGKGEPCTRYKADHDWMDHAVTWTRDRKPAAITAAPYYVSDDFEARLDWWTQQDARLRWTRGAGWYGHGTTQLILWRTDRVADIHAA